MLIMKHVTFENTRFGFCCGFQEVGGFETKTYIWAWGEQAKDRDITAADEQNALDRLNEELNRTSNTFAATFINTEECETAYNLFISKYKLKYQSEPETNRLHNSQIFMCIFERVIEV